MNIEELKDEHYNLCMEQSINGCIKPKEHAKLSIEFVISVLESMKVNTDDLYSDIFDTHVNNILKGKIQELKEYLDEI